MEPPQKLVDRDHAYTQAQAPDKGRCQFILAPMAFSTTTPPREAYTRQACASPLWVPSAQWDSQDKFPLKNNRGQKPHVRASDRGEKDMEARNSSVQDRKKAQLVRKTISRAIHYRFGQTQWGATTPFHLPGRSMLRRCAHNKVAAKTKEGKKSKVKEQTKHKTSGCDKEETMQSIQGQFRSVHKMFPISQRIVKTYL